MAIDTTYQMRPGETVDQYNARIQAYNASKGDYANGRTDLNSFMEQPTTAPPTDAVTAVTQTDQQFQNWLNGQNLSADQKQAIQSIYQAVGTNDVSKAQQISGAISAAYGQSDPYFKAQIALSLDALNAGIQGKENDLAYQIQQQRNTLTDIQNQTAAAKDKLSFDASQQLQGLATKLEQDLETNRNNLAATGFTNSTRRVQTEGYINQANDQAVASTNHTLAYNLGQQDNALNAAQRDDALNIQHLQDVAKAGELSLYRTAEGQVGSSNLPSVPGLTPLSGVGGDIPKAQATDALTFVNSII